MIKARLLTKHKRSLDVVNKLSGPNALYDRILPLTYPSLSTNLEVNLCVCVWERECARDLVLQPSSIGLELSIDQSGLWVEIKVFLSLDTWLSGWGTEERGSEIKGRRKRCEPYTYAAPQNVSWQQLNSTLTLLTWRELGVFDIFNCSVV